MKRIHFLILFFVFYKTLAAQQTRLSATVSREEILIGEPFQLTLQAQAPLAKNISWFAKDSFPHFEVLQRSAIDTQINGGTKTLVQNLQITSWDSGRWQLPSFSLPQSNRTKPLTITVSFSAMDKGQKYNEVKDILEVEKERKATWHWYLIGAALLLLFLFLLFPGKKSKSKEEAPAAEGAYRDALKQLDALQKRAEREDVKVFYTELVLVLRQYLLRKKGYQSLSKTTDDIYKQLNHWHIKGDAAAQLTDTLRLSDGVKFARFEPSNAERKTSLDAMRKSIALLEAEK